MTIITSFAPVVDSSTRLLILGTMPSAESLRQGMYYGHPRNHFWPLMARLLDKPLPDCYGDRLYMLAGARIGLWDVFKSCQRPGSLDQNIRNGLPNDLEALLTMYPGINSIALNGSTAAKGFRRHFPALVTDSGLQILTLPSSSPIPTRHCPTLAEKWIAWQALSQHLPGARPGTQKEGP